MITVNENPNEIREYPQLEFERGSGYQRYLNEDGRSSFYKYGQSESGGFRGYSNKVCSNFVERQYAKYCSQHSKLQFEPE